MTLTSHVIARAALWASVGINIALGVWDVAIGAYLLAAWQSIVVAFLTAWLWIVPTVHDWAEAQRAEAVARQRIAELSLEWMQREGRRGNVRVTLRGGVGAERSN